MYLAEFCFINKKDKCKILQFIVTMKSGSCTGFARSFRDSETLYSEKVVQRIPPTVLCPQLWKVEGAYCFGLVCAFVRSKSLDYLPLWSYAPFKGS